MAAVGVALAASGAMAEEVAVVPSLVPFQGPGDSSTMNAAQRSRASPALNLLHRYETRLHLMYQRSLHNLLVLRQLGVRFEARNLLISNENPEIEQPNSGDLAPKTAVFIRSNARFPRPKPSK